jgi:hypothetical protein
MDEGPYLGKIVSAPVKRLHGVLLAALDLLLPGSIWRVVSNRDARESIWWCAGSTSQQSNDGIDKEKLWVSDSIWDRRTTNSFRLRLVTLSYPSG